MSGYDALRQFWITMSDGWTPFDLEQEPLLDEERQGSRRKSIDTATHAHTPSEHRSPLEIWRDSSGAQRHRLLCGSKPHGDAEFERGEPVSECLRILANGSWLKALF